jgi:hypothetical protein
MEDRNEKLAWEAMEVEESGHVGEVMQGSKLSLTDKGASTDIAEG